MRPVKYTLENMASRSEMFENASQLCLINCQYPLAANLNWENLYIAKPLNVYTIKLESPE